MPQRGTGAIGQDWGQVGWDKAPTKASKLNQTEKNNAIRRGELSAETRTYQNTNKKGDLGSRAAALDRDTETLKHATVSSEFKKALAAARNAKGLNQKQLGTLINEKPQVIAEYETGKAIPDGQIVQKLNRALGVQLPRAKAVAKKKPKA